MTSLLPPSSTKLLTAIADACADLVDLEVKIRDSINPDKCPPSFLPYLAWARAVDRWDAKWSINAQRQVVKDSFIVHSQKGTVAAVRRAIATMGYQMEIRQWYETTPPLLRGAFELDVSLGSQGISEASLEELERIIDDAKPLSRPLINFKTSLEIFNESTFIAALDFGEIITIHSL